MSLSSNKCLALSFERRTNETDYNREHDIFAVALDVFDKWRTQGGRVMRRVYDRFADEYIDESEKSPYAPPERYTEITEELLVENAARWFLTALKRLLDEEREGE